MPFYIWNFSIKLQREREKDWSSIFCSPTPRHPRWPQQVELGQAEARRFFRVPSVAAGVQGLGPSTAFPGVLAESQAEQPDTRPVPIWDVDVAGCGLGHNAGPRICFFSGGLPNQSSVHTYGQLFTLETLQKIECVDLVSEMDSATQVQLESVFPFSVYVVLVFFLGLNLTDLTLCLRKLLSVKPI